MRAGAVVLGSLLLVVGVPRAAEEIENECSRCHMPMSNVEERVRGRLASVFAHLPVTEAETELDRLAIDGVSCTLCHQITEERLGTEESFSGGFVVDTLAMHGRIFGPFEVDGGRARIMRSATTFEPTPAPMTRTFIGKLPQCRKWRMRVNTIAMPCSSAAWMTSSSRMEPPG